MDSTHKLPVRIKVLISILAIVAIGGIASSGVLWTKLQEHQSASAGTDAEISGLIKEISKVFVLPSDETPELLTVTDLDQLKGQAFFANAMVGDKVLVYSKNSKAVLWRPATKKIIEASVINIAPTAPSGAY